MPFTHQDYERVRSLVIGGLLEIFKDDFPFSSIDIRVPGTGASLRSLRDTAHDMGQRLSHIKGFNDFVPGQCYAGTYRKIAWRGPSAMSYWELREGPVFTEGWECTSLTNGQPTQASAQW